MRKAIIVGNHPLSDDLIRQYKEREYGVQVVSVRQQLEAEIETDFDELVVLSDIADSNPDTADHEAVALLGLMADKTKLTRHRILCHLVLRSQKTLRMLQTTDFCDAVKEKMDVYPTTMEELWSRAILLDYEPITVQSEKHVHLVIFGMGEMAEMVAMQAALTAHFPNYIHDHSKRTRITMVSSDAVQDSISLTQRYQHLFDNSYYRLVKPRDEKPVVRFHPPMYKGKREDFVDVEWEFVEAESWDTELRSKLVLWAGDSKQLLTVVMAYQDGCQNLNEALCLPNELRKGQIPIYIYAREEFKLTSTPDIKCFGMQNTGYDVTLPLVRMAKTVNYVYDCCFEANLSGEGENRPEDDLRYNVEMDEMAKEAREESWAKKSNVKRMSNIYNAMTIASKLRSVGLREDDWEHFYDISQQDIELLAQVEHNRWNVEELILGFRPCTDDEQQYVEEEVDPRKEELKSKKIHYDLRAYDDLRIDKTGKTVKVYDRCICSCLPLIAKAFADERKGGGA